MSNGRLINPIKPKTKVAANRFGIMPMMDNTTDLNKIKNIINIDGDNIASIDILYIYDFNPDIYKNSKKL